MLEMEIKVSETSLLTSGHVQTKVWMQRHLKKPVNWTYNSSIIISLYIKVIKSSWLEFVGLVGPD